MGYSPFLTMELSGWFIRDVTVAEVDRSMAENVTIWEWEEVKKCRAAHACLTWFELHCL